MKRTSILSAAALAVAGVFVAGAALAEASHGAPKSHGAKKSDMTTSDISDWAEAGGSAPVPGKPIERRDGKTT
jgi:hypothetical protein